MIFVAEVRPRWSDMDAYGHVNHARTVTLLEEARIELLFTEAERRGAEALMAGVVVGRLAVDFHAPLVVSHRTTTIRVELSVLELRVASFTLSYRVYDGPSTEDTLVATAETMMVPYDLRHGHARRLSEAERDFLASWRTDGGTRTA